MKLFRQALFSMTAILLAVLVGTGGAAAQDQCTDLLLLSTTVVVPAGTVTNPSTLAIDLGTVPTDPAMVDVKLQVPYKVATPDGGYYDHRHLALPWLATIVEPAPGIWEIRIDSFAPAAVSDVRVIVRQLCG